MGFGSFIKKVTNKVKDTTQSAGRTVTRPLAPVKRSVSSIVRTVNTSYGGYTSAHFKRFGFTAQQAIDRGYSAGQMKNFAIKNGIEPIKLAITTAPKVVKDTAVTAYKTGQKTADHVEELGNGIKNTVSNVTDTASSMIKTPFKMGNDLLESSKNMMDTGKKIMLGLLVGGVVLVGAIAYKKAS